MKLSERVHLVGSGNLGGQNVSGDLDCNVYLLNGGCEFALIDAGGGPPIEPILDAIRADGIDPAKISVLLLTHKHADHAGGAAAWQELLSLRVAASRHTATALKVADSELTNVADARSWGTYPPDYSRPACRVDDILGDGSRVTVGDLELVALCTPGHCDGHLSFYLEGAANASLFSGDAVFAGGTVILQPVSDCRVDDYARTLQRLSTLRVDALFPGHGMASLRHGGRHIRAANAIFSQGSVPPNLRV